MVNSTYQIYKEKANCQFSGDGLSDFTHTNISRFLFLTSNFSVDIHRVDNQYTLIQTKQFFHWEYKNQAKIKVNYYIKPKRLH